MGSSVSVRGPLLGMGDLGGDGGTGRTEEGADRGVDLAVGGLEEELGLGGIHAAGHLAELGDLVVHGCRHVGRERVGEWICVEADVTALLFVSSLIELTELMGIKFVTIRSSARHQCPRTRAS